MWYKEFGWKQNPFTIKANTNLFGIEFKKINLMNFIYSGDLCFLTGPMGTGKSSLLKWVENNIKNHKIYYIDAASINHDFSITKFLQKRNTFFNKLKGNKFPTNVVILLDESQDCDKALVKALKLHWDHKNIKSIVITQIENLDNFTESFKDRIGERIIKLGKISKEDAIKMINFRTQDKNPFDKSSMEYLIEKANQRPRKILEYCELICQNTKKSSIKISNVKLILKKVTNEKESIPKIKTIKDKLSPMQNKIINNLSKEDKTAKELSKTLNSTEGSVGKQLSKLIKKKKIKITNNDRPKKYGLIK